MTALIGVVPLRAHPWNSRWSRLHLVTCNEMEARRFPKRKSESLTRSKGSGCWAMKKKNNKTNKNSEHPQGERTERISERVRLS